MKAKMITRPAYKLVLSYDEARALHDFLGETPFSERQEMFNRCGFDLNTAAKGAEILGAIWEALDEVIGT